MESATGAGEASKVEVADELVDEASIVGGKAIVRFNRTKAELEALRRQYEGVQFDVATTRGNEAARAARKALVSLRTGLENRRKSFKFPAIEFGRQIDSQSLALKIAIEALEDPIDQQIKADEQRREEDRQAKLAAEQKRCDDHRARIADISAVATRAVGLPSAEIQAKIDLVTRIEIDATFEEFEAAAGNVKHETLLTLKQLHARALEAEAEAARVKADRERLAQLERENAERLKEQQAEQRRRAEDDQRARAAEQAEAAARQVQSNLARELIAEISRIQARAFTSSAAGMLELVSLIEGIKIGSELGDFEGPAQKAREDALATLHMAHGVAVEREAEKRRLEQAAADLTRQQEEWRAAHPPAPPEVVVGIDGGGADDQFEAVVFDTSKPIESMETAVPAEVRDLRINDTPVEEFVASLPQAMEILAVDVGHELPAKSDQANFVRVPVLRNFDQSKQIGELTILQEDLPPTPDFVFSIGFQVLEMIGQDFGRYKLETVSLQSDDNYIGYLQKAGKLPPLATMGGHVSFGDPAMDALCAIEPTSRHDISASAPNINTAEICKRLGFVLQVADIEDVLGVKRAETVKTAVFWRASQWPAIVDALVRHIGSVR